MNLNLNMLNWQRIRDPLWSFPALDPGVWGSNISVPQILFTAKRAEMNNIIIYIYKPYPMVQVRSKQRDVGVCWEEGHQPPPKPSLPLPVADRF